jgi:hypothetical protein
MGVHSIGVHGMGFCSIDVDGVKMLLVCSCAVNVLRLKDATNN